MYTVHINTFINPKMSISKRERYTEGGKEEGGREREREALTR